MEAPDRKHYLGGSDIGAIAGVNPYRSRIDVFSAKLGLVEDSVSELEAIEWGNRLERPIAEKYAQEHKVGIIRGDWVPGPKPFLGGTPDFLIEGSRKGLEIKTAGFFAREAWGADGTDDVPEHYALQCHWYMALTGCTRWDLAVLIAGQGYREYQFGRDEELCRDLVQLATDFWERHIARKDAPAIDGSDAATAFLKAKFPRHTKPLLRSTPTIDEWAEKLRDARNLRKHAETAEAEAKNHLRNIIGDAEGIQGPNYKITWKEAKGRPALDTSKLIEELKLPRETLARFTKTTPYRVFRPVFDEEEG